VRQLQPLYPPEEARALSYALLQHVARLSRTHVHAFPDTELPAEVTAAMRQGVDELLACKPLQYITGETVFCGCRIEVNEAVLIPRPETEELVRLAANSYPLAARRAPSAIIDLCTGSGCIAIALAKRFPDAAVYACDISEAALEVARRNAANNNVSIRFFAGDVLAGGAFNQPVDCIVSNPPYVRHSEKALMHHNVLRYEPPEALFVDDRDPLVFYRAIAAFAQRHLRATGALFVEINEALGSETQALFAAAGFSRTALHRDINGKNRMLKYEV
jgi:release factor glutamine methyltransferase